MGYRELSDVELVQRLGSGDEEAFAEVYRRNQAVLYRFALHMSGSVAMAEDVTQDVFVTLIDKASEYDGARGSLAAYLYGIARKHLLRHFARSRGQFPLASAQGDELSATPELLIDRVNPLDTVTRVERIDAVRRAVLSLPLRYREAVVLCELQELDYQQAAVVAGCAVGTIRSRLHRGRALLLSKLRDQSPHAISRAVNAKGCLA